MGVLGTRTIQELALTFAGHLFDKSREFGPYACIQLRERPNNFNLSMHTLPPSGILSSAQHVYPTPQPGQTVLAERQSRRVSTHRPALQGYTTTLVEEMPTTFEEYCLASSTS